MKQSLSQLPVQIMFAQHGEAYRADDRYNRDDIPDKNLGHITCNYCGEKGHYVGIRD